MALQFRVVVVGSVFKVLSQYRVQQRSPLSSSLTFILVEVFKVYAQAKVQQRFLEVRRSGPPRRSLTFQFLVVEVPAVFLVLSQNREPQLHMLLRNAFVSGLSRSMLVEIFLLVVQVLVSFA